MSATAFVCQEDTLRCQLICRRRMQGLEGNKKPCSFSTCSCWAPRETLTTDQSRLTGINSLI